MKVVALVEVPSTQSMGILGVIMQSTDHSDEYFTSGILGSLKNLTLTRAEFERHIVLQNLMRLPQQISIDPNDLPLNALWIGSAFYNKAIELQVPPTVISAQCDLVIQNTGSVLIGPAQYIYGKLEVWIKDAMLTALQRNNYGIARLMAWTLPDRDETKVALYFTSPDDARRSHELEWFSRLEKKPKKEILARLTQLYKDAHIDKIFNRD